MMAKEKPMVEQDWREVPKSEMLKRVIVAVDVGRGEAQATGDANYVRYCNEQLFPFLEAERDEAAEAEYGQILRYLTNRIGVSEEEAHLMMRDDDLWIIGPEFRYGSELDKRARRSPCAPHVRKES